MNSEDFKLFSNFLEPVYRVPEEIMKKYADLFQEVYFDRKQIITPAGSTEKYLYFVVEGYQRSYYLKEGKEHVMAFTYPPSYSGVPESFISGEPSRYFLETITPSRMYRIHKDAHSQIIESSWELERLQRKITELVFIGITTRHHEWMALSMEERFKSFFKRSPHLINHIPHKDLASYLRMDPANFSRLLGSVQM